VVFGPWGNDSIKFGMRYYEVPTAWLDYLDVARKDSRKRTRKICLIGTFTPCEDEKMLQTIFTRLCALSSRDRYFIHSIQSPGYSGKPIDSIQVAWRLIDFVRAPNLWCETDNWWGKDLNFERTSQYEIGIKRNWKSKVRIHENDNVII